MNVTFPIPRPMPGLTVSGARLFLQFSYLQVLDALTTLAFLLAGVQEANPLVRWMIACFGAPVYALIVVKMGALMLGLFCWWKGKYALLRKVNVWFSFLVAWNLFCLILGLASHARS